MPQAESTLLSDKGPEGEGQRNEQPGMPRRAETQVGGRPITALPLAASLVKELEGGAHPRHAGAHAHLHPCLDPRTAPSLGLRKCHLSPNCSFPEPSLRLPNLPRKANERSCFLSPPGLSPSPRLSTQLPLAQGDTRAEPGTQEPVANMERMESQTESQRRIKSSH